MEEKAKEMKEKKRNKRENKKPILKGTLNSNYAIKVCKYVSHDSRDLAAKKQFTEFPQRCHSESDVSLNLRNSKTFSATDCILLQTVLLNRCEVRNEACYTKRNLVTYTT